MKVVLVLEIDEHEFFDLAKELNESTAKVPVGKMGHAFAMILSQHGAFGNVRCAQFGIVPIDVPAYGKEATR